MRRGRTVRIELNKDLYRELMRAASECRLIDEQLGEYVVCTPEAFAQEAVESVLAERRLSRMAVN